jgi:hypothetical protein
LFAPGNITTEYHEHSSPVFSPDGSEVYWSVFFNFWGPQVIMTMRMENGRWTQPEVAPFSGQYSDGNPCFLEDGKRIFFESRRPVHAGEVFFFVSNRWLGNPYFESKLSLDEIKKRAKNIDNGMGNVFWVDAKIIEDLKKRSYNYGQN